MTHYLINTTVPLCQNVPSWCPRRSNSDATGFRCTTWLEDVGWCIIRKLSPFEDDREVRKQKNAADIINTYFLYSVVINVTRNNINTFKKPVTHSKIHYTTSDTASVLSVGEFPSESRHI